MYAFNSWLIYNIIVCCILQCVFQPDAQCFQDKIQIQISFCLIKLAKAVPVIGSECNGCYPLMIWNTEYLLFNIPGWPTTTGFGRFLCAWRRCTIPTRENEEVRCFSYAFCFLIKPVASCLLFFNLFYFFIWSSWQIWNGIHAHPLLPGSSV